MNLRREANFGSTGSWLWIWS